MQILRSHAASFVYPTLSMPLLSLDSDISSGYRLEKNLQQIPVKWFVVKSCGTEIAFN